jgi:hypothetical protein
VSQHKRSWDHDDPQQHEERSFLLQKIVFQKLGIIACKEDKTYTKMSVLLFCIQRSSLFNQKIGVGEGGNFKDHYFVRCDYCNNKSHSHQVLNIPVFVCALDDKSHLECDNSAQKTRELVTDKEPTIDFGKMKVSHFDAWDVTVSHYLQAVLSSSCKVCCFDVYFTRLPVKNGFDRLLSLLC